MQWLLVIEDPYAKVDVFGSWAFKGARGQTLITVGVNNVFDRDPSLIYLGFAATPTRRPTTTSAGSSTRA